jgi:hypothetical protein
MKFVCVRAYIGGAGHSDSTLLQGPQTKLWSYRVML